MDWTKQLQDETRNAKVLGFGATYIRGLTVVKGAPGAQLTPQYTRSARLYYKSWIVSKNDNYVLLYCIILLTFIACLL